MGTLTKLLKWLKNWHLKLSQGKHIKLAVTKKMSVVNEWSLSVSFLYNKKKRSLTYVLNTKEDAI